MKLDEFFEAGWAKPPNLGNGDARYPVKVGSSIDQAVQVEIRGYWIELCLWMQRARHLEESESRWM